MEERGHGAGYVLPPGGLRELPLVKRRGTHDSMTERQVALLGSIGLPWRPQCNYNLFTQRRASKDYKRSIQRQVSDEVLKKRASKKRYLTQIIKHSLKAI